MGIKDLLRFMKSYVEPIHIKKYAGQRVGIDAYSWLHKGAYACSMELSLNMEGDKKLQYLNYFMHRINLLRHYNITPVVVFDGGNIPCKSATAQERDRRRKANRDLAMAKLKEGNVNAASELFQRAISITPLIAHQLIQILRAENIEFIVAPYEADAQLAYLSSLESEKGGIVAVISEDSDLLAYGCPAIIFKMDRYGSGEEMVLSNVFDSVAQVPSFLNFNEDLFLGMCVLAGCDFLPSVPGIGIAKAYKLVSKYRNLDRVLSILKFEKGNQMLEDYPKGFKEAIAVFKHARIYDVNSKQLKHIKPLSPNLLQSLHEELDFLGPELPSSVATAIAEGNLDPCTMEAFDYFPNGGNYLRFSTFNKVPDQLIIQEETAVSIQQSSFTVISSRKSAVVKQKPVLEERKQKLASKYMDEAAILDKLIFPLENEMNEDKNDISDKNLLKVPDNNPFKKRKLNDAHFDSTESVTEPVSVVTEDSLELTCLTKESQQSIESKPMKMTDGNLRGKSRKKVKKSNCHCSENKSNSILNFFSRV